MNIEELTIKQVRELQSLFAPTPQPQPHPYPVGKHVIIRTVTMTLTGNLVEVHPQELVLTDACWVADSGRWAEALKDPNTFNETEPFPDGRVIVGRGSIVDCCELQPYNRSVK